MGPILLFDLQPLYRTHFCPTATLLKQRNVQDPRLAAKTEHRGLRSSLFRPTFPSRARVATRSAPPGTGAAFAGATVSAAPLLLEGPSRNMVKKTHQHSLFEAIFGPRPSHTHVQSENVLVAARLPHPCVKRKSMTRKHNNNDNNNNTNNHTNSSSSSNKKAEEETKNFAKSHQTLCP